MPVRDQSGLYEGQSYIAGDWSSHNPLEHFKILNPSTGKIMGGAPTTMRTELDRAVDAANDAFKIWGNSRKWSWVMRAEVVDEWVQVIKASREEIAILMTQECGKHINESRADVTEGIHMLQVCAGMGRHPVGHKISSEIPDKDAETIRVPRGVCTVITPWNFPFAIPTWLIGPALVSGDPVVFKPSEETPLTAQFLVELFDIAAKRFHVPPGTLNLVHGPGAVGEYLVRHEGTVGQLFTGSWAVGSQIKLIAAAHHDKFAICEMGGKNSLIVLNDANLELAVTAAVLSAFKTAHQRCVSADVIIVEDKIEPEFTRRFLELADRVKFGDPFDPDVFSGPLINRKAVQKYLRHADLVSQEAEETLRWMQPPQEGNFVGPSIFRMRYRPGTFALREEAFTPNVVIVPVTDFEEALYVANDTQYGLSMALCTENYRAMHEFKIHAKAGLKYINLPTIGAEVHLPFGGMRRSGTGMPSAAWLFNYLCHETAITINYSQKIKMAQGLSAKV